MRERHATAMTLALGWILAHAITVGCGRNDEPPPTDGSGTPAPVISGAIGDDLGQRDLTLIDAVRGTGRALRGTGTLVLGQDDEWIKRAADGWQLARLEMDEREVVFAWVGDGEPLLSEPPTFRWERVALDAGGNVSDHVALVPERSRRPQGYVLALDGTMDDPGRADAIVRDVVDRSLSAPQAEAVIEIVRRRYNAQDDGVLAWLERLARGDVALATLERIDAGVEEGQLFGRRQIELRRGTLERGSARWYALRDQAAVALLPASAYQRTEALRDLLTDARGGHHALRAIREHHPLPRPMAVALVELAVHRLEHAGAAELDALRVQVTAVLDAVGGHDWELMTDRQRAAAERRERELGGDRHQLDLAVDLAIAVMRHPSFDVQQIGARMIERWTEWGWPIAHRQRLESAMDELGSDRIRDRLREVLDAAD